jgi:hypothetical protein
LFLCVKNPTFLIFVHRTTSKTKDISIKNKRNYKHLFSDSLILTMHYIIKAKINNQLDLLVMGSYVLLISK